MNEKSTIRFGEQSNHMMPNKYEVKAIAITSFRTATRGIVSCALNHNKSLFFVFWENKPNQPNSPKSTGKYLISIFTLEGYCVTTKKVFKQLAFAEGAGKFTDEMIILSVGNCSLVVLTDFSLKLLHFEYKLLFIEFDEKGNIYTNGHGFNAITVYKPNLKFKRKLIIDHLCASIIESVAIRDDELFILVFKEGINDDQCAIHRFKLSTLEIVESIERVGNSHVRFGSSSFVVDQFRNIYANTSRGVCIWPYIGKSRRILFQNGRTHYGYEPFLITNDSRIIGFQRGGTIHLHQLTFKS